MNPTAAGDIRINHFHDQLVEFQIVANPFGESAIRYTGYLDIGSLTGCMLAFTYPTSGFAFKRTFDGLIAIDTVRNKGPVVVVPERLQDMSAEIDRRLQMLVGRKPVVNAAARSNIGADQFG